MDPLMTTATSRDEQDRAARVAVLPVGSYEQHGAFLPLITDTVVACLIARRVSADYGLLLLPACCCSRPSRCRVPMSTAASPEQ
jgi:creatinine amidohydrolase